MGTFESWNLFNDRLSHIMYMHIHYKQRRNRKSKPVGLIKDSHRAIQDKRTAFKKLKNAPFETNTKETKTIETNVCKKQSQKGNKGIKASQRVRPSEALQQR